jgi:monooxygenase
MKPDTTMPESTAMRDSAAMPESAAMRDSAAMPESTAMPESAAADRAIRTHDVDVLIVGAGISGISAACHTRQACPTQRVAILEQRDQLGGTWDLFRYPGIRSDSDMNTLGFRFKPWTGKKAIADGPDILQYLKDAARENDVESLISYGRRVRRASWSSDIARWTLDVDGPNGAHELWHARYLWMCSGYYDYDHGYTPEIAGREDFGGTVIHPQQWPQNFDASGKQIVVIGSGATAFTLVPSLAKQAGHVTMLQRSPTYVVSAPAVDRVSNALRRYLPDRLAYAITRWKNVLASSVQFWIARRFPAQTKKYLLDMVRKQLPAGFDVERHFTPAYEPWDQRICAVPDSDFFGAIKAGTVSVVTNGIDRITETGIRLTSGEHLECDVIVTATGLNLQTLGGAELVVDGTVLNTGDLVTYKGLMYAGVPNMSVTLGYFNASWTLKADLTSEYTCRLLAHMEANGLASATPRLGSAEIEPAGDMTFAPGYFKRSLDILPRQGTAKPWRLNDNYLLDIFTLRHGRIDDGVLEFRSSVPAMR